MSVEIVVVVVGFVALQILLIGAVDRTEEKRWFVAAIGVVIFALVALGILYHRHGG
jgi:hypothetical protein